MSAAAKLGWGTGWVVVLALVLTGCFAKVKDLPALAEKPAFAPIPEAAPDLLVGLAISGGGSRAATFGAGVLEALARVRVKDARGERSVLEKVQYISSVSGGSLATGYFAARKPPRSQPVLGSSGFSPAYEQFFKDYKAAMQEDFELPAACARCFCSARSIPRSSPTPSPKCGTRGSSTG
jgi:hypothetical protein